MNESYGYSGIWINDDWILTNISSMDYLHRKSTELHLFITNLKSRELTMMPHEFRKDLNYHVYRNLGSIANAHLQPRIGTIVACWNCELLTDTYYEFFRTWNFKTNNYRDSVYDVSIFLLMRVGFDEGISIVDTQTIEQVLSCLLDHTLLRDPIRGSTVEILSTPFGIPAFFDSLSQGIVSNIIGEKGCIIITDAMTFPYGNGSPVYTILPNW